MNALLKKALPHIIAVVLFLIIAIVYCQPALQGKVLYQSDVLHWKGSAQQSVEYKDKYGHFPLWTESTFSGMPTYTIYMDATAKVTIAPLYYLLTLGMPKPITYFFIACICFYILTQVLRINPWVGILSSLAYAYSTFDPVIIVVGHDTQMFAIGYMPAVIAGTLLIYQGKYLPGAALLTAFFGLQVTTQHIQIIYYTGLILGFITIGFFIISIKKNQIKHSLIAIAIALVSGLIGFGTFALNLLPLQEYAKETMRGGRSELTSVDSKNKTKGGLDKDYAFGWSYGISEVMTAIVPGMYGGGSDGTQVTGNSKFAEKFAEVGMPEDNGIQYANSYSYWGNQPSVAGPVYFGAVIWFLFILGLVYVKSWHKWWVISAAILGVLLAWGKNFSAFNYFLFDHLPLYNKFRAPSMGLVMPQLAFPLLAGLGLNELLEIKDLKEILWKKFKTVLYITAGVLVVLLLLYFSADYKWQNDAVLKQNFSNMVLQQMARGKQPTPEMEQQVNDFGNGLIRGLQSDRQAIFGNDLLRSFLLIAVSAVIAGLYLKNKIKPVVLIAALLVLSSYDLLAVGRRYLNDDKFVEQADYDNLFAPTAADRKIKSDPDKNFRVFDETSGDPFSDSRASYFHNSIGGYHPAKLALYEDIKTNQLLKGNMRVFDMLNTKYFIVKNPANGQEEARLNPDAYGPCWLVKSIHYVNNADEEMKALDSINVRDTAIVQKNFQPVIKFNPQPDSTASIKLISNLNDKVDYKFSSKTNQFAVFSEIYYDKGWDAYLDGKKTDYCRVDYVLRGMPIPAGEHTIEFRFEPRTYIIGNTITTWSSILVYLLLIGTVVTEWRKRK